MYLTEFKIMAINILNEVRITMQEQSENFNKEKENVKKYQKENIKLKNTITKLKNSKEGFESRLDEAEEMIRELDDRAMEFIYSEQQKKKKMRMSDGSLRDLDIKRINICNIGIPGGKEGKGPRIDSRK